MLGLICRYIIQDIIVAHTIRIETCRPCSRHVITHGVFRRELVELDAAVEARAGAWVHEVSLTGARELCAGVLETSEHCTPKLKKSYERGKNKEIKNQHFLFRGFG